MILKLRGLKFIEIYSVSVKCSKIRGLNFPPTVVEGGRQAGDSGEEGGSESADTPDTPNSGDESDVS